MICQNHTLTEWIASAVVVGLVVLACIRSSIKWQAAGGPDPHLRTHFPAQPCTGSAQSSAASVAGPSSTTRATRDGTSRTAEVGGSSPLAPTCLEGERGAWGGKQSGSVSVRALGGRGAHSARGG